MLISSSSHYHYHYHYHRRHRRCLPISTQPHHPKPKELPFQGAHYLISSLAFSPITIRPLKCPASTNPTATPQPQQPEELPFIAQYLISSFGFWPERALRVSSYSNLAAITSPDQPETVIQFLKDTGLSDSQIKDAISRNPVLLEHDVEKTLKPTVRELLENGFSGGLLVQLIVYNPGCLVSTDTLSHVLFWKDFVGKGDEGLLELIPKCPLLFTYDITNHVVPVINLLKEYKLSNRDIVALVEHRTSCMKQTPDYFRQKLEIIEELGIRRGSRMFVWAISAVSNISHDTLIRKLEFFKITYGWSEKEVYTAFSKCPRLFTCSEDKLKSNMDFLITKAGSESRRIALQPALLAYSVERVLLPRYTVLSALQAKGLKKRLSFHSACKMSERNFFESFVVPYEKDVPGLGEAYAAAYGVKVLV